MSKNDVFIDFYFRIIKNDNRSDIIDSDDIGMSDDDIAQQNRWPSPTSSVFKKKSNTK